MTYRCASIFSDNMVLQRGKKLRFFGTCEGDKGEVPKPGHKVTEVQCLIEFRFEDGTIISQCLSVNTNPEYWDWEVIADPISEAEAKRGELSLSLRFKEDGIENSLPVLYAGIVFGEVYLAGGQSNMELELGTATDGKSVLEQADKHQLDVDVRYYYTQKKAYIDEDYYISERNTAWQKIGDQWMKSWSAVGYYFAEKLAKKLDCPVGIIGCNWGGTSAACWQSREMLLSTEETRIYVEDYDKSPDLVGKTESEQIEEFKRYLVKQAEWDSKMQELYASVPGITWKEVEEKLGKCLYPGPLNAGAFHRPYGLYNTMIKRVAPYSLQGFIYYQGENDAFRAASYYNLMGNLIAEWRKTWKDENAYFLLTQLPMHRYEADEDTKSWCLIREAQERVSRDIDRVSMAVAIDQGEFNEIHPKYKRRVGLRLAKQALYNIYNKISLMEAAGPELVDCRIDGRRLIINYNNVRGFEVCKRLYGNTLKDSDDTGEVRKLAPNDALGFELVIGSCNHDNSKLEEVISVSPTSFTQNQIVFDLEEQDIEVDRENILAVRYLWTDYSEVNLYGVTYDLADEPLPLAPFYCLIKNFEKEC